MNGSTNAWRGTMKRQLLVSASVCALMAYSIDGARAADGDTDRPLVWLELGWQYEGYSGQGDPYAPSFLTTTPRPAVETFSPISAQRMSGFSYGPEGRLSFQPEDSDWVFSASVLYGHAHGANHKHHQTNFPVKIPLYEGTHFLGTASIPGLAPRFAEVQSNVFENHTILDFQAGKDVGLGMFGADGKSVFGFGIRFAQSGSSSKAIIGEDPDSIAPHDVKYPWYHHVYQVSARSDHSFHGIGPSLSWDASMPVLGSVQSGEVSFDWGVNAALLFGRQKVKAHHQTTISYYKAGFLLNPHHFTSISHQASNPHRSRTVTVPNIGGFAGVSVRYSDAKFSLGYRGDFFFGAMDSGIDTAHRENVGFYGPFASVSVGIGG